MTFLLALNIISAFTWSGVNVLEACSRSATAPLATAVAMLVPLNGKYVVEACVLPLATYQLSGV